MKNTLIGALVTAAICIGVSGSANAANAQNLTAYCSSTGGFDQIDGFKGPLPPKLCALIKEAQLTPERVDRALTKQPRLSKKKYTPKQLADRLSKIYQRYADEDVGGPLEGEDVVRSAALKRAELFRALSAAIG